MIPILFEWGPIKLYSFGLMAAIAFLSGSYLLKLELDRRGYAPGIWNNYAIGALLGGFVGARINYLITHMDELRHDWRGALFSGSGLVWYGGFIGGVLVALWLARRYRHSFLALGDAFAPGLTVAYIFGRVGCLVSGDGDYGRATTVPWAMSFPNGIVPTTEMVHPTPIYEVLLMLAALGLLWRTRKRDWAPGAQFGLYLLLAGTERLVVEFWRRNEPGLLGLTTAQLVSAIAMACGLLLWSRRSRPLIEATRGSALRIQG